MKMEPWRAIAMAILAAADNQSIARWVATQVQREIRRRLSVDNTLHRTVTQVCLMQDINQPEELETSEPSNVIYTLTAKDRR